MSSVSCPSRRRRKRYCHKQASDNANYNSDVRLRGVRLSLSRATANHKIRLTHDDQIIKPMVDPKWGSVPSMQQYSQVADTEAPGHCDWTSAWCKSMPRAFQTTWPRRCGTGSLHKGVASRGSRGRIRE